MDSVSIAKRLKRLTRGMILAVALVGAIGVAATLVLRAGVDAIASSAERVQIGGAILEDLMEMRQAALIYRIAAKPEIAERVSSNAQEVLEQETAALDAGAGPEVAEVQSLTEAYLSHFGQVVERQAERDAGFAALADTGKAVRTALSAIMESAYRDGDPIAALYAGRSQERLLLARLYMERFFADNAETDYAEAMTWLAQAQEQATALQAELQNPERRRLLEEAMAGMAQFGTVADRTRSAIRTRNDESAMLDTIGPKAQTLVEAEIDAAAAVKADAKKAAQTIAWATLAALLATAVGAGYVAARVAGSTAKSIQTGISTIQGAMSTLASGDLDCKIEGAEHDHELGRMAQALVVFRDAAKTRKEAEAAEAQRERERQAEAVAARERQEAAEAKARAKADAERRSMLETLRSSVGAVVTAAAEGDFSPRIEAVFDEPELRDMATAVNRLMSNVEDGMGAMARILEKLAEGDLTQRMTGSYSGLFARLQADVNQTIDTLDGLVREIAEQCEAVGSQAAKMTGDAQDLSKRAEQQAASLEQTAAAMEEISSTAGSSAENASQASATARDASARVDDAAEAMASATRSMEGVKTASDRIADIVAVIDSIAFQTNLLALNASVEAARAGSAGKGFSVVASEVRALAQRAGDASRDIRTLLDQTTGEVEKGVRSVEMTGETLDAVVARVREMAETMQMVTMASREQATGVHEVSGALAQMDRVTQSNAALAEQTRGNARALADAADRMRELIGTFRTRSEGTAQPAAAAA